MTISRDQLVNGIQNQLKAAAATGMLGSEITPEQFDKYAEFGRELGVTHMYSGPFVRSSYNADLFVRK